MDGDRRRPRLQRCPEESGPGNRRPGHQHDDPAYPGLLSTLGARIINEKYSGKCLCGAIQYACTAEPAFSGNCHCKDCQRSSGGPFIPAMLFPASAVTISGTPKYFKLTADSGKFIERGFCGECGSQLFTRLEALP